MSFLKEKIRKVKIAIHRREIIVFIDLQLIFLSYLLAFMLRFDMDMPVQYIEHMIYTFPVILIVKLIFYIAFRINRSIWRYTGIRDLMKIIKLSTVNNIAYAVILYLTFQLGGYPKSVILLDWGIFIMLFAGARIIYKYYIEFFGIDYSKYRHNNKRRCLIIGAGDDADNLLRSMSYNQINYTPVGALDDAPNKWNRYIQGVKILGPIKDTYKWAKKLGVDEIIIAIHSATEQEFKTIYKHVRRCEVLNIDYSRAKSNERLNRIKPSLYARNRENKNILVIGGAGYIGSALLPKLLERGYNVRLLDLFIFGKEAIAKYLRHPNLEIIENDFRKVDVVVSAMQNIDTVIHLGAIVGDPACALNEDLTVEINHLATRMIAEVARGYSVDRFIFASTCSVYGANDNVLYEDSELNPVSLYARSKLASEESLLEMSSEDFSPIILRFSTIYGFSGRLRLDLVVNLLTCKAIMDDGNITVFGGDQWRPFLHVDDAALSVLRALEAPTKLTKNEIFNVGSNDQNFTIQQVGELINRLVPDSQVVSEGTDGDRRNYRVNFDKIRKIMGFSPNWTVEAGIKQVIAAIQKGEIEDYTDPKYSNVKFLTEEENSQIILPEEDWAYKMLNGSSITTTSKAG
jgi:nucleoside-diphosphate-sugar epimerase